MMVENKQVANDKLKAFTVMLRAAQALQEATKKEMMKYGLNQTEFAVLELLYHKGEQPIQVIGKKILIASSSITYVIDKLEQKGFVQRRACATDRRVTYAEITDAGIKMIDQLFPQHIENIENIFDVLTNEEISQLVESVKKVGYSAKQFDDLKK